jgi:hypothetical protein
MAARKPPEAWYWSYDISPEDLSTILVPGARLVRLSSYRKGTKPRLAALAYKETGAPRRHVLDLPAAAAAKLVADTGERPVSVTVAPGDGPPQLSLVLESGPGPVSRLELDLDEAAAHALLDGQHGITDLATYTVGGARKYAAIVDERATTSWLFTGVTQAELDAKLVEHGAALVRVRAYADGGRTLFAAVAERMDPGAWAWYPAIDAEEVSRKLEQNQAFPVDLDATRDDRGLRFSVVMYRST